MTYKALQEWIYGKAINNEDKTLRGLAKVYSTSLETVTQKIAAYNQKSLITGYVPTFEEFRLNALKADIDREIQKLYELSQKQIKESFYTNYKQTYYYQSYGIEREINTVMGDNIYYKLNTPILNINAIEAAFSEKIAGYTFLDRSTQAMKVLQWKMRELVSGAVTEGITVQQLASQIQAIDAIYAANKARALTAARTELLRAFSLGNDEARIQAEEAGVEFEYMWSAALDAKTRPDHRAMDGKKADIIDGQPVFTLPDGSKASSPRVPAEGGFLSDKESINCRCARLDLPYGIEPTSRVAQMPSGEYKDVAGNMTAEEWYKMNYEQAA